MVPTTMATIAITPVANMANEGAGHTGDYCWREWLPILISSFEQRVNACSS